MAVVTIQWLWSWICHCLHFPPSICHEVMGLDDMILVFWMLSFKPAFSLSSFTFIKVLFSSSSFSPKRVNIICISEVIDISPSNLDSSLSVQHRSTSTGKADTNNYNGGNWQWHNNSGDLIMLFSSMERLTRLKIWKHSL